MTPRTDRQRIEAALPARLVWYVSRRLSTPLPGTDEQTSPELPGLVDRFSVVVNEALGDELTDEVRAKLARRLDRALGQVFADLHDRPIATALVGLRHLIADLISSDAWSPPGGDDGGAFWAAWDDLARLVYEGEGNGEVLDAVDRSASRWAARALVGLRTTGLYATRVQVAA